jgi:hypothetical protein
MFRNVYGPIDKRDNILANGNMVVWRIWVQVSIQHFFQVFYSYIGDMWRSQFNVLFLYLKVLQSLQVLFYDGSKHIKHSNVYSFLDAQTISEVKMIMASILQRKYHKQQLVHHQHHFADKTWFHTISGWQCYQCCGWISYAHIDH